MRYILTFFFFVGFCCASQHANAFPPITIYNYYLVQPGLSFVSVTPSNHQDLAASPGSASVTFSQAIDPGGSDLKVYDPYNNPISTARQIPRDNGMSVTVPAKLLAGVYRVEWKAICGCKDRNAVSGTSYFTIR
jgi:methionine-rich copper-binding protein CopC